MLMFLYHFIWTLGLILLLPIIGLLRLRVAGCGLRVAGCPAEKGIQSTIINQQSSIQRIRPPAQSDRPNLGERLAARFALDLPDLLLDNGNIWVHALSVGEVVSALPLISRLRTEFPDKDIVFTATTSTGVAIAREKLDGKVKVIVPMPVDAWWSVQRIIHFVKPSIFILVETDIWPALLNCLKQKGIRSILVNGRISPRTFRTYRRAPFFVRKMFNPLEKCLMQSDLDRQRLLQVGLRKEQVITAGNIKFDLDLAIMSEEERQGWLDIMSIDPAAPLWVAGSTHPGEEEILLDVFKRLRIPFPRLRLILASRDTGRSAEIVTMIRGMGLNPVLKTEISKQPATRNPPYDVLVLNTMGELGRIYGLGAVCFVGGSLVPVGGHNLLEPASFGIPVLFGPHTHNFVSMSEALLERGGGCRVGDGNELYEDMKTLLEDTELRSRMGAEAKAFVEGNRGALKRVMDHVKGSRGQNAKRKAQGAERNPKPENRHSMLRAPCSMPNWSRIHREKGFGPWTFPLAFLSFLYGVGVRLRLSAYRNGILRGKSLPGFVLSVGNLTAGGTGKTPAVVMLAGWALGQGYRVAILSRGYGAQTKQKALEVSNGEGRYADARTAGDEPSLLAKQVPESPVVISKSRYKAGRYAHTKFGSDFFILDDGFQHLELERNLNLTLIDASNPFGNGHLLPWGPLREPLHQLSRADAFILSRFSREQGAGRGEQGQRTLAFLKERFPSTPVFRADHLPDKLVFPLSGAVHDPGFLKKKRVVGFAGIAHPEHFEKTLIGLGADVVRFRGFRDHYIFNGKDLDELIRVKKRMGAHYIVTTEKDWMRIASVSPVYSDLSYLSIRFALQEPDGIFRMIKEGL